MALPFLAADKIASALRTGAPLRTDQLALLPDQDLVPGLGRLTLSVNPASARRSHRQATK